jgi:hypothetical protein
MTMIIGVYNIDVDVSIFSEKFMIYLFFSMLVRTNAVCPLQKKIRWVSKTNITLSYFIFIKYLDRILVHICILFLSYCYRFSLVIML